MSKQIFRKVSLERLSSPEQLDLMVRITSPAGWLSLLAIGLLIAAGIVWGIYGSIPTKVIGKGILIKSGGVYSLDAPTSGKITGIYANVDSIIEKGQIVARIAQPEILNKINENKAKLNDLKKEFRKISQGAEEDIKLQLEYIKNERANLISLIKQAKQKLIWLKEKLKNNKELLKLGLITKDRVINIEQQIYETRHSIEKYKNQIQNLKIKKANLKNKYGEKAIKYQNQIYQLERRIQSLEEDLETTSRVISPYSGRVLEISVEEDKFITRGKKILTLELIGKDIKDLEGVIYVSPIDGKKIKSGMKVEVAPSNVKQEEYGFMLGIVTRVSEFPATPQGMIRILQNENLVNALSGGGAPIEVRVTLIPSSKTFSGYKWSSKNGPPIKIHSGTLCFSSIIVREQPPITLVLPLLKKYLLGIGAD